MTKVQEILTEYDYLVSRDSNYRSYCQELADYALSRRGWITSMRYHGERIKFNFRYDSTATLAARTAAHGIHSNLTNETMRWFALESTDNDDMRKRDSRMWFKEVEDLMFTKLRGSNFYNVIQEDYLMKIVFGTGTYSMFEDEKDFVQFRNMPVERVHRVVDDSGRLIGIFVSFSLTALQAYKLFGEDAGKSVVESLEKKPHESFEFLHHVSERFDRDPRYKDALNAPYKSCWISIKDKHIVRESGFQEMPYISDVFYADNNDANGFSPMMDVLPWVKLVNAMFRTIIRAGMKVTDPPVVSPSKGFVLPLNFNPAAINYRDPKTPQDALQMLQHSGRVEIGVELINMVRESIKEGLFVPLFQALNNVTKQMSILETQHLISQNMSILGPVVGRFDYGTLSPTIFRLYNMLQRADEIPPPPESLFGKSFKVVYLGPLAKAQRQAEIAELQTWISDVGGIAQVAPRALHNVDEDKVVSTLHRMRGITPEVLRSDEDVARMRAQEAEQQQLAMMMQAGQGVADIGKTLNEAQR